MKLNNPKVWAVIVPIVTALGGYFGYQPIQDLQSVPEVNIEVTTPDTAHAHPKYTPKDWQDAIERADKRSMDAHKERLH